MAQESILKAGCIYVRVGLPDFIEHFLQENSPAFYILGLPYIFFSFSVSHLGLRRN